MQGKTNLFLVGAAKSGTTSLYNYLDQHPDIYTPSKEERYLGKINPKEPKFFSSKYHKYPQTGVGDVNAVEVRTIKTLEEYSELYSKHGDEKYILDASIDYLYYYGTAEDIYKFNSDSKVLILLRNPVERAYSAYTSLRRDCREFEEFSDALEMEEKRMECNHEFLWAYKGCGLYYRQVKEFIDVFGSDNVLVLLYEDLRRNPKILLRQICFFLKIEDFSFEKTSVIYNVSGIPKKNMKTYLYLLFKKIVKRYSNVFLKIMSQESATKYSKYLKKMLILKNMDKQSMNNEVEMYLYDYFRNDIEKLENLLNKDLTHWKKKTDENSFESNIEIK